MDYRVGYANRLGNRSVDQDRFAAVESDGAVLLALADGMGGRSGGELAAEALVETARQAFVRAGRALEAPENFLRTTIQHAHQRIVGLVGEHGLPSAPGTTAVLCLVRGSSAWWAHVGDSRLYLFRNGLPLYRTQDHSYVEELYQDGRISRDKREVHPMRNYVTRCVGCQDDPKISVSREVPLRPDDILLLCSDGLWSALDDARMGALLLEDGLEAALERMAGQAERAAYPRCDNLSALALQWLGAETATPVEGEETAHGGQAKSLDQAIADIQSALRRYGPEMKD